MSVLVVDGANVVGIASRRLVARPGAGRIAGCTGGWRSQTTTTWRPYDEVVLVLEGQARGGVPAGRDGHLRTVHASRDGDATVVAEVEAARERGRRRHGHHCRPGTRDARRGAGAPACGARAG